MRARVCRLPLPVLAMPGRGPVHQLRSRFLVRNPAISSVFPDRFVNRFGTDRLLGSASRIAGQRDLARSSRREHARSKSPRPGGPLRRVTSTAVVITFALVMTACVLGVVVWKAFDAKKTTLASGSADIQNLAHSLSEHASHTIQSVDIAMAGMVDLLKYRDPEPDRFNRYLAETAKSLPQLRGIGVARCRWQLALFVACRKRRATTSGPAVTSPIIAIHRTARFASASRCSPVWTSDPR